MPDDVAAAAAAAAADLGPIEDERLNDIERYFMSALSVKIGEFMKDAGARVELIPLDEEHPIDNTMVFKEYQAMVEEELEKYLEEKGMAQHDLVALVESCSSRAQAALYCIDYILATTEYAAFLQLVADHRSMDQWGAGDGDELGEPYDPDADEAEYIATGEDADDQAA